MKQRRNIVPAVQRGAAIVIVVCGVGFSTGLALIMLLPILLVLERFLMRMGAAASSLSLSAILVLFCSAALGRQVYRRLVTRWQA